ncbi:DUF6090 family protein [Hanstruepera ponticola]|uniref:DUF6090 family protein n=1 Tax=Hanstruepera ponticola TaxID=2042995 RepID=UPI0013C492EA|nr:DUF6090 family protein [Hanstruepera ponticola]
MIKFFRKIRYDLMEKNKTGKYLKYVIGEIVLVVIGILIALQINNWNEGRKQQLVLDQYYELLLGDYEENKKYINTLIISLKEGITSFENYYQEFGKKNLETNDFISELDKIDNVTAYLKFENPTIQTVQHTGEIKLLPATLREKILILNGNQERWTIVNNSNNEIFLSQQMKAIALGLKTNIKIRANNHPQLNKDLQKEVSPIKLLLEAEAAFALKYFTEKNLLVEMQKMIDDITEVESLIKKELNKK